MWQIHPPAALPPAKDIDIKALADYYELTGGQIALIVKNTAAMVAGRKGKCRRVFQADLIKYCELERDSSFDKTASDCIGFRAHVRNGI